MPQFKTSRIVAVPFDVAYRVASDVAEYKSFLPLLERSAIRGAVMQNGDLSSFNAELAVGYAKLGLREMFVSHVICDRTKGTVTATSRDAPFKDMKTVWTIVDVNGQSEVSISIDYSMRNVLIGMAVGGAMDMAVKRVMSAFEARAKTIYNASKTS
jgi:coenzyme Q-binding protein COQ10